MTTNNKKPNMFTGKRILFGVVIILLILGTTIQIVNFLSTPDYKTLRYIPESAPVTN